MGLILFLLLVPAINLFILIVVRLAQGERKGHHTDVNPIIMSPENHSAPAGEGYKDTSDIADKIDGRLTNVFTNPWKGVL